MELVSFILLGCLIGMQHALEADHLAAVAALSEKRSSRRALVLRGGIWGLGHTITLITICGALLFLGEKIAPRTEAILEAIVGAMIVVLGINVLVRVWRQRPHLHIHRHADGVPHMHVHSHTGEATPHKDSAHEHEHHNLGLGRALIIGMVHGAAGSAGLMILAAAASSIPQAASYVIAFGAGSIIGMSVLSFIVSFPLRWIERCASWVPAATFAGIGGLAIVVGGSLIGQNWSLF